MTVLKPQFSPLFPIPFGYVNFGESFRELNKNIIKDIEFEKENSKGKTKTFTKNSSGWQSNQGMETRYKSFKELSDSIFRNAIPILFESGVSQNEVLSIGSLWANMIYAPGGFSIPHLHGSGRTIWTGVYYPKGLSEEENLDNFDNKKYLGYGIPNNVHGALVCKDPNICKRIVKFKTDHQKYYGHNFSIIPRESLLVLFPAWMEHFVTPTIDNKKRYSISFAINVQYDAESIIINKSEVVKCKNQQ